MSIMAFEFPIMEMNFALSKFEFKVFTFDFQFRIFTFGNRFSILNFHFVMATLGHRRWENYLPLLGGNVDPLV